MMELGELIARIEGLTGPDREVDAEIAIHFGERHGRFEEVHLESRSYTVIDECAKRYTASLDAAVALAVKLLDNGSVDIEVAYRTVGGLAHGRAEICGPHVDSATRGATPAIALVLATLKALEASNAE